MRELDRFQDAAETEIESIELETGDNFYRPSSRLSERRIATDCGLLRVTEVN